MLIETILTALNQGIDEKIIIEESIKYIKENEYVISNELHININMEFNFNTTESVLEIVLSFKKGDLLIGIINNHLVVKAIDIYHVIISKLLPDLSINTTRRSYDIVSSLNGQYMFTIIKKLMEYDLHSFVFIEPNYIEYYGLFNRYITIYIKNHTHEELYNDLILLRNKITDIFYTSYSMEYFINLIEDKDIKNALLVLISIM